MAKESAMIGQFVLSSNEYAGIVLDKKNNTYSIYWFDFGMMEYMPRDVADFIQQFKDWQTTNDLQVSARHNPFL
jgi:hypothetical protein